MIKLQLPPKPKELSEENEKKLVEKFLSKKSDVWNVDFIKTPLLNMTFGKCAYSEMKDTFLEIDHFRCKSKYPNLVVSWGNLLPCYKYCNIKKGNLDIEETPIINPLIDNPKDYLYIDHGRYYARNTKGKNTKDLLGLNDNNKIANIRSKYINILDDNLERIFDDFIETNKKREKILGDLIVIMNSCTKENPFSASLSTHLLYESEPYNNIKTEFQNINLWSSELQDLENELKEIALPK